MTSSIFCKKVETFLHNAKHGTCMNFLMNQNIQNIKKLKCLLVFYLNCPTVLTCLSGTLVGQLFHRKCWSYMHILAICHVSISGLLRSDDDICPN